MTDSASIPMTPLDRDQVLDATASCFERYGFEGTTIRRIAARLNCAVGSIYRYFTDKQDLLTAMSERQMADVAAGIDAGGSVDESMRLYVLRAQASPQMYRLMFWLACVGDQDDPHDLLPDGSDDATTVPGGADPTARGIPAVVRQIVTGWSRRLGDAHLAQNCWAMLHGSLMLGRSSDEIVQLLLTLLGRRAEIQTPLVAPRTAATARITEPQITAAASTPAASRATAVARPGGQGAEPGGAVDRSPLPEGKEPGSAEDVCLL